MKVINDKIIQVKSWNFTLVFLFLSVVVFFVLFSVIVFSVIGYHYVIYELAVFILEHI
jgi:hypothetical protein